MSSFSVSRSPSSVVIGGESWVLFRQTANLDREAASIDQRINPRGFLKKGQTLLLLYQVDGRVSIRADHLTTICPFLLLGSYLGFSP